MQNVSEDHAKQRLSKLAEQLTALRTGETNSRSAQFDSI